MPRGDGTGPSGEGPLTGRGAGTCADNQVGGYGSSGPGRGAGWECHGGRRSRRHRLSDPSLHCWERPARFPPMPQSEREALSRRENWLGEQLEAVRRRLKELEPPDKE